MMVIKSIGPALLPLIIFVFCNPNAVSCDENDAIVRNKKHFSLFSVITFKNEECSSEATWNGGQVKGTCYSTSECSDKDGTKSGNCAAGFGVCCIFTYNVLTDIAISRNRTYLENPLFPNTETTGAGTTTTYTVNKMSSDICQIRLDFDYFVIAGPANTREGGPAAGDALGNCLDTMTFAMSGGAWATVVCGVMTGQHLYLDMGMDAADTAAIALALGGTTITAGISGITVANAFRKWRVKTSQIPCWAPYRAPDGCHQYFFGQLTGQIVSANFKILNTDRGDNALNSGETLLGQNTKYCIRREMNHCCTLFQVCNSYDSIDLTVTNSGGTVLNGNLGEISEGWSFHSWLITAGTAAILAVDDVDIGLVDAQCTTDYVEIPDSQTGFKSYGSAMHTNTRYCGHRLGHVPSDVGVTTNGWMTHAPIWKCSEPYEATYRTDQMTDIGTQTYATAIAQAAQPYRGLCLDFRQDAC